MKNIVQKLLCLLMAVAMVFSIAVLNSELSDGNDSGVQTQCIDEPDEILD